MELESYDRSDEIEGISDEIDSEYDDDDDEEYNKENMNSCRVW